MVQPYGKAKAFFCVHAFDSTWAPVGGFPVYLKSLKEVTELLERWKVIRHHELVLGKTPMGVDVLHGVSCMELECFYE